MICDDAYRKIRHVTKNMIGSAIIEESQCSPDMRISTQIPSIYLALQLRTTATMCSGEGFGLLQWSITVCDHALCKVVLGLLTNVVRGTRCS